MGTHEKQWFGGGDDGMRARVRPPSFWAASEAPAWSAEVEELLWFRSSA